MSRALRVLLLALLATAVVVAAGVLTLSGGDDGGDGEAGPVTPEPSATSTPLAEVDTTTVALSREGFCDAVAPEAVTEALSAEPQASTAYDNGEPAPVTARVRDVAHEFGCSWRADRRTARAWLFAPPVTPDQARGLVGAARRTDGCAVVRDAPDFGRVSVALRCETPRGPQVSFRGLFGDAWLACSVSGNSADFGDAAAEALLDRAGRWCVAVVQSTTATEG